MLKSKALTAPIINNKSKNKFSLIPEIFIQCFGVHDDVIVDVTRMTVVSYRSPVLLVCYVGIPLYCRYVIYELLQSGMSVV